jgi:hypothetical protein
MDEMTPALAEAFRLLRQDIYGYLDEAEFLSTKLTEWTEEDAESARRLVPDLVTIVRGILADHKETAAATCPRCNTRWPCSTVNTIHALVKNPDHEFLKIIQRAQLNPAA